MPAPTRLGLGFTLAGLVTSILALWTPEIMGSSYTTLDRLLAGEGGLGLGLVLAVTLTKQAATGTAVGLRVPGGLIGPTLFIGGAAGSVLGMLFGLLEPMDTGPPARLLRHGRDGGHDGGEPQGAPGRLDRLARAHR